jgi:LPXTG-motif cell wall-anchored protein
MPPLGYVFIVAAAIGVVLAGTLLVFLVRRRRSLR